MEKAKTTSRIFAYTYWDILPVFAAIVHLTFNIFLIIGFNHRSLWVSILLGCIYAFAIAWNHNSFSHHFIHTRYFRASWMNDLYGIILSICNCSSQSYFSWVHWDHHRGNNDQKDGKGNTVDPVSIFRYGKDGKPENVWSYALFSYFRSYIGGIWHYAFWESFFGNSNENSNFKVRNTKQTFNLQKSRMELLAVIVFILFACIYNWKAFLFYLPFYYLGQCLSALNTYYEHLHCNSKIPLAFGVSCYNPLYNWVFFNNGYHGEHHYRPGIHWSQLKAFHAQIRDEQAKAGAHSISTWHMFGFLAKENRAKEKMEVI